MDAYTIPKLACDAGVSVHVVRDYMVRGLLRPVERTAGSYGVFDADALQRLRSVRSAFEAGVGLDVLTRLRRAPDAPDADRAATCLAAKCVNSSMSDGAGTGGLGGAAECAANRGGSTERGIAMNGPDRKSVTDYLWAGLAVLTCLRHLPILAVVLARATVGAFLSALWVVAALGLISVFVLSVLRTIRTHGGSVPADTGGRFRSRKHSCAKPKRGQIHIPSDL